MKLVLSANNLSKTYNARGTSHVAVAGISLNLHAGEILGLLGPNGAGKTTMAKMISGLVCPDQGTVEICGANPFRKPSTLRNVGVVLEGNRNLYWKLTPAENLEYFGVLRGLSAREARTRADHYLNRFGLSKKKKVLVEALSRGMQQKVAICAALLHEPTLLLLDEPTLGLDIESLEDVKTIIQNLAAENRAIVLTTHQLDVAQAVTTRTAIMKQGKIIAEENTSDLLKRFSGDSYVIEMVDPVAANLSSDLQNAGCMIENRRISFHGDNTSIWKILGKVDTLPIERFYKDKADLAGVFMKLTKG